jgi:hypothetical protein
VSWLFIALLACAVAIFVAAEWPRIVSLTGNDARRKRARAKRKPHLRVVQTEEDDFAASVQRDLENLPTIDERERR